MTVTLNIERLLRDIGFNKPGGPQRVAAVLGVWRTVPYRWVANGYVSSRVLEKIKAAFPKVNLNKYFERR